MNEIKEQEPRQTNVVVLIGAPASGKSTQFEHLRPRLEHRGFVSVPEVERDIIEEDRKNGIERDSTPEGHLRLENRFLKARAALEKSLNSSSNILMDRGLPDIAAYLRYYKADESDALDAAKKVKYRQVFYLEPLLNYEKDTARIESPEFAKWMHENLPKVYEELGYEVVRVPVFPYEERESYASEEEKAKDSINQRSKFILEKMKEVGLPV